MKETTKQNLAILAITFLLVGSVFIFMNYTKPQIDQLKQTLIAIEESNQKLQLLKNYQNKFQSLIKTYQSSQQQVDLINEAIPDNSQTAQIVALFNAINQKTGVKSTNLSFTEQNKDQYGTIIINTEIITSYEGLKAWFQEIEKELRLLDLNQITIKPVGVYSITTTKKNTKISTTGNQPLLDCNVSLTAYYQI
jgi:Tfp pilus assembly protein PilO